MMKTTMALVVVATFAGAAAAPAQQGGSLRIASAAVPPIDRAAALRAQAEELFSKPRQRARAAGMLERSAEIGGTADVHSYASLITAGRLRATLGDYLLARHDFEKAAAHALARGSVVDAAHAYIDAAHAAAADGQSRDARGLLERAALLTESPLLSREQADDITRRIRIG